MARDIGELPIPVTRSEKMLDAIARQDTTDLPRPQSRNEEFLEYIAYHIVQGGTSGGEGTTVSAVTSVNHKTPDSLGHVEVEIDDIQDLRHILETKAEKRNPFEGKTILCYGDSFVTQNKWQPLLVDKLKVTHVNFGQSTYPLTQVNPNNAGFSLSSDYQLNRLSTQITDHNVEMVLVMAGVNDLSYDGTDSSFNTMTLGDWSYPYNLTTIKGAVSKIIKHIRVRHPGVELFICTQPNTKVQSSVGTENSDLEFINAQGLSMIDVGRTIYETSQRFGVPCIDVLSHCGITHFNRQEFVSNEVLLNDEGAKRVANVIISELMKYQSYHLI